MHHFMISRGDSQQLLGLMVTGPKGEEIHCDEYGRVKVQFHWDREGQRDASGRLLVKTLPDGEEIHYSYDALGRLVNFDDGNWPLAYEYDVQDRLITEH